MNKFDQVYNKIIKETLNQKDQQKINNLIKDLNTIKQDPEMISLNDNIVDNINKDLKYIKSFGKTNTDINSKLLYSLKFNNVEITDDLIQAIINTRNKLTIPEPDIPNLNKNTLYVFDGKKYIWWRKNKSLKDYLIPIEGDSKFLKIIFNATEHLIGDVSGKGELLADHLFNNFTIADQRWSKQNINNKIDGNLTDSNIEIDVKHTSKYSEGIHNINKHINRYSEFTDDHGYNLKPNTLYLIFDFKFNQAKYALVYYNKK